MKFVYVDPDDLEAFEQFDAIVHGHRGHLFPVFLQCSTSEIVRRIGNPDRGARKKMASEQSARDFLPGIRSAQFRDRLVSYWTARPMMQKRTPNASFVTSIFQLDSRLWVKLGRTLGPLTKLFITCARELAASVRP